MLILMVHFSGVFSKMNTTILLFTFFKCLCLLRVWKNISEHVFLLISGRKRLKINLVVFCSLCSKKWNPTYRTHLKKMNFDVFWAECPHQLRKTTLRNNNWAECPHQLRENTLSIKKEIQKLFFWTFGFFWAVWEFCEGYLGFIFWKQANLSDLSDFRKSCFWWFCSFRDPHLWANCLVDSKTGFRSRK